MLRISLVAVSPIALPNHPSKDVDLLYFVADGASNLELPSILEVLPKPAAVIVFPTATKSSPWTITLRIRSGWKKVQGQDRPATNPMPTIVALTQFSQDLAASRVP